MQNLVSFISVCDSQFSIEMSVGLNAQYYKIIEKMLKVNLNL